MLKKYQVDEVHDLLSRVVVVLDEELLHWRFAWSSTVTYHLFLDTQSQMFHGLGEAGFYASSNQILQPLRLSDFASDLQSISADLEFGWYPMVSSSIQA